MIYYGSLLDVLSVLPPRLLLYSHVEGEGKKKGNYCITSFVRPSSCTAVIAT